MKIRNVTVSPQTYGQLTACADAIHCTPAQALQVFLDDHANLDAFCNLVLLHDNVTHPPDYVSISTDRNN